MADAWLEWGADFVVSASGGLLLADNDDYTRQRIERRILTAVRGYVWHQDYGAGLPQKVGSLIQASTVQAIVRSQIALEASVAPSPAPVVTVSVDPNTPALQVITIKYRDAANGEAVTLSFSV